MPSITRTEQTILVAVELTDQAHIELSAQQPAVELDRAEARTLADILSRLADEADTYLDELAQGKRS